MMKAIIFTLIAAVPRNTAAVTCIPFEAIQP